MEKTYRLLLAEDEPKLSLVIQEELNRQGYITDAAYDGNIASRLFEENIYSLVILDINLPYKNGLALCKEIREKDNNIPIIMLTALGEIQDKVDAFTLGADDYIVKPFHFDELFARVKVFLKRTDNNDNEPDEVVIDELVINNITKTVTRSGNVIPLTNKEFALLFLLARNRGKVVGKAEILKRVWDLNFDTGTNAIEVYISFLRNKIDKIFNEKLIYTKAGFGYFIK